MTIAKIAVVGVLEFFKPRGDAVYSPGNTYCVDAITSYHKPGNQKTKLQQQLGV